MSAALALALLVVFAAGFAFGAFAAWSWAWQEGFAAGLASVVDPDERKGQE